MEGLNPAQQRFVNEYLVSLNATDAYKKAGYKARGNSAEVNAKRLLSYAKISAAVNKEKRKQQQRTHIKADRVLLEAARIAFADTRQLYSPDGSLKPIHTWPDDVAAAVASIDMADSPDGGPPQIKRVRFWSKPSQLDLLAKHLKLLVDEPQTVVNVQLNVKMTLGEAFARAYGQAPPVSLPKDTTHA
jgi:phage terminase small subunit